MGKSLFTFNQSSYMISTIIKATEYLDGEGFKYSIRNSKVTDDQLDKCMWKLKGLGHHKREEGEFLKIVPIIMKDNDIFSDCRCRS